MYILYYTNDKLSILKFKKNVILNLVTAQKGFAPILIVLILAVAISVGGYLVYQQSRLKPTPTPTPQQTAQPTSTPDTNPVLNGTGETANWKTYTNTKYKYAVEYPSDWEVTSVTADAFPENVRFTKIIKQGNKYVADATVNIIVEANPSKKPATKKWYLEWIQNIPAELVDTTSFTFEEKLFYGYQGLVVNNRELFFAKDSYMFRIGWSIAGDYIFDDNFAKSTETIYNQILSTFRFLP